MTPTAVGMRCPECARQRTKVHTMRNVATRPQVTIGLIAINVIVYLAGGSFTVGNLPGNASLYAHADLFGPAIANHHEYWRLITAGFLHAGLLHIGFNMYLLYILGQILEPALGHWRFALLYVVSLLAGSFGALLVSPDAHTIGASGAVFGLMGATVLEARARGISFIQNQIGFLIVINLVFSFTFSGISIGGHIGGLVGGGLSALALRLGDRYRSRMLGLAACVSLGAVAVAGSIAVA
jgi:membrane associated rhomboid family serine protease